MASWFIASACLSLRVLLPGLAWSWWVWAPGRSGTQRVLTPATVTVAVGLALSSLTALTLGALDAYTPVAEWIALMAITCLGLMTARHTKRASLSSLARRGAATLGVCMLVVITVLALPNRGEWIMGGWDPGVYVNEAIALDQQHSFHPDDAFYWQELTEKEQQLFIRTGKNRTERFPGAVIQEEDQSFVFQFFRLTPSLFGMAHRSGGLPLLLRMNTLLGILSALCLFCIIDRAGHKVWALLACLTLVLQPIFLYHAHTPVSEMAEMTLLLTMVLLLPYRSHNRYTPVLFALTILAATLNRFTFIPFAAFFVMIMAWFDMQRDDRKQVLFERALQVVALVVGLIVNYQIAPLSMEGWSSRLVPSMMIMAGVSIALAIACDLLARIRRARSLPEQLPRSIAWVCLATVTGWMIYLYGRPKWGPINGDADNIIRLINYVGLLPLVLSVVGAWLYWGYGRHRIITVHVLGLFLCGITCLIAWDKNIVDWYPWATRRYHTFVIPFVALFASQPIAYLWDKGRTPRVIGVAILAIALGSIAPQSYRAWFNTEYNGVLEQLDAVRSQIDDDDVIIADDPRWGTPLTFIHGAKVLNGKRLWRDKTGDRLVLALEMAERMTRAGKRVRFLTSTDDALTLYPHDITPVSMDWTSEPFAYREIIHHERASSFRMRDVEKIFRLYTYMPETYHRLLK